MTRAVLFDFDGTLADTKGLLVSIYNELAAKNGFASVDVGEIDGLSRLSIPDRCRRLGVPMMRVPALLAVGMRRFREQMEEVRIFEGIPQLLHELQRMGLSLGIASSNDTDVIRSILRREGLDPLFGSIAPSSSLFGKHKTLQKYKRKNGYRDEDLVYIGDELRDIEACQKANVPVAAVAWGYDHEVLLRGQEPDLLAREPMEIAHWIRSRPAAG